MIVPPEQVSAQLERILASPGFAGADRASRFLRFVVERTIAGEGDQLKEYVIGRAVFDRGDDYDPRIDSIVRVEAGRLRSKVEEYYSGPGRGDNVIIQLRKGSYAPAFDSREVHAAAGLQARGSIEQAGTSATRPRVSRTLALVAAGIAVLVLVTLFSGQWVDGERLPPAPTIAVLPFKNYSEDPAEKILAARVTDGITAELARLGTLGVVSHTSAMQFADVVPRPSIKEIAKTLDAHFILEGKVRDEGGQVTIQVVLVDAWLDRKVWVHDLAGPASEIPALQRQMAQAASAAVLRKR